MRRIIIADDHPIVRQGLKQIVMRLPESTEIDEARDGKELLEQAARKEYDLILLDILMPGKTGMDVLRELKAFCPDVPVLILSTYPEDQLAIRAIRAGAHGYLNKESAPEALLCAVKKVLEGKVYISPELAEIMAADLRKDAAKDPHERLTDREFQIMTHIAEGLSLSEIAQKLCISVKTVSTHRANILQKTGFRSNSEMIRYAVEHKLV